MTSTQSTKARNRSYYERNRDRIIEKSRKYRLDNLDRVKETKRKYHVKNKEEIVRKVTEWQKTNRDKVLGYKRKHNRRRYESNPDFERSRSLEYRSRNLETCRLRCHEYKQNNPDVVRSHHQKRRANLAGAAVGDIKEILYWENSWRSNKSCVCFWCGKTSKTGDCHADHIIPISRLGEHVLSNLVVSCSKCNQSKHAKSPCEFVRTLTPFRRIVVSVLLRHRGISVNPREPGRH